MSLMGQGTVNVVFEYMESWNKLTNFISSNKGLPRIPINFEVKTKEVEKLLKDVKLSPKDQTAVKEYTKLLDALLKQYKEIAKANQTIFEMSQKHNTELKRTQNITGEILRLENARKNAGKEIKNEINDVLKTQTKVADSEKKSLDYAKEKLNYLRQESKVGEDKVKKPSGVNFDDDIVKSSQLYQISYIASQTQQVSDLANSLMMSSLQVQRQIEHSLVITNSVAKGNQENLRQLYDMTTELGRVAPISLEEIANSMYELASAGLGVTEIMKAMPQATKLSIGVGENLDTVLNALISTVNGFDKEFSDSSEILDVFAKAVANSQATIEKLNTSFSRVAPFAQEAGVSLEETTTMLSLLYDRGMSASRAGTVMTNVMQYLSKFTDKSTEALLRNGLSTTDVDLKYVSFKDSMVALANANLDASASYDIFGQRGKLIVTIFEQMRKKAEEIRVQQGEQISMTEALGMAYDDLNNQILGAGSVNDFFNATIQTTDYTLNQLSNSWKETKLNMAETTKDAVVPLVQGLTSLLNFINDTIKSSKVAKGVFVSLTVALGTAGILGAVMAFALKLQATIGLIKMAGIQANILNVNLKTLSLSLGAFSLAVGVIATVLANYNARQQKYNELMQKANIMIDENISSINTLTGSQSLYNDKLLTSLNLTIQQKEAVKTLEDKYGIHLTTLGDLRDAQRKYNDEKAKGIEIDSMVTKADVVKAEKEVKDIDLLIKKKEAEVENMETMAKNLEKVLKGKKITATPEGLKKLEAEYSKYEKAYKGGDLDALGMMQYLAPDIDFLREYLGGLDSPTAIRKQIEQYKKIKILAEANAKEIRDLYMGGKQKIVQTADVADGGLGLGYEGGDPYKGEYKDFSIGALEDLIDRRISDRKFSFQEDWKNLGEEKRKDYSGDYSKYEAIRLKGLKEETKTWVKDYVYNISKVDKKVADQVFSKANLDKMIENAIFGATPKKWQDGGKPKVEKEIQDYKGQISSKDVSDLDQYNQKMELVGKSGEELLLLQLKQAEAEKEKLRGAEENLITTKKAYDLAIKAGTLKGKEIDFGEGDSAKAKKEAYELAKDNYEIAYERAEKLKDVNLQILEINQSLNDEKKKYTAPAYEYKKDLADLITQKQMLNLATIEQLKLEHAMIKANEIQEEQAKEDYINAYKSLELAKSKSVGIDEKGALKFLTSEDTENYKKATEAMDKANEAYKKSVEWSIKLIDVRKKIREYYKDLRNTREALAELNDSEWDKAENHIAKLENELKLEKKKEKSKQDQLNIAKLELQIATERQAQLDKQASILSELTVGALTGNIKITADQLINQGYSMAGKGKGEGSAFLAFGVIQQLSDNLMSEKLASLEYEKRALDIRKQLATTEEERKKVAEEELALAKRQVDLQYQQSTNYMGITGTTGSALSGITSGAITGSSFGHTGAMIGAGLGLVGGILGGSSAERQAEREKEMLEYQMRMSEYLERVALNTEGSNNYLATLVEKSTSVGIERAQQLALDTFLKSNTTKVGGSATADWNDRTWHGGWNRGWSDNWIKATANYTAKDFGYSNESLSDIKNVQTLLGKVIAKQKTVGGASASYNTTEGAQAQARANYLALEEMKKQLQTIINAYKNLAPAIYKAYFGAMLEAVKDSTGKITNYIVDWSAQIGNILNESWTETMNGFSKTANLTTKTVFEGIMKATVQNSTQLNAVVDKIILLQEKIAGSMASSQISSKSNYEKDMASYFKELVSLVNQQAQVQESLNKKAKEYIKLYLDNGGKIEDIMSYMGSASNNIYQATLDAMNSGDISNLFTSMYNNFSKDFLQPYYEDILNSSRALKDLMVSAMSGTIDTTKLSSIYTLINATNMTVKELTEDSSEIAKILGLSSEAMAQFINLKKVQESLEAISEAYDLYNNTKDTIESAIESGVLDGINSSGEYSKEALENSIGKNLKDIIFQNIIDGVLTQTALQAKINYLSKNMMNMTVAQIEALMNGIISDTDKIFKGLEPFIDSMNDIFDKYTGVNDEPIVFFDETNMKLAEDTANSINGTINDVISGVGGTAISTIDELLNKTNNITDSLNNLLKNVNIGEVKTTSTKTVYLKISADSSIAEIQNAVANSLSDKVDEIEILY